jgi:hypothetical protein
MSKIQSPLLGYNNNVRHKNRVFHIQTEDSGIKKPHIITHLFMDGGRILKSVKTSYAEHLGADGMSDIVRGMMKDQHKAMFIALRDGQFDHLVDPGGAPPASVVAKAAEPAPKPLALDPSPASRPAPAIAPRSAAPPAAEPAIYSALPSRPPGASPPPPSVGGPSRVPTIGSFAATHPSATIPAPPPSDATLTPASGRSPMATVPDDSPLTTRDSVPAAAPAEPLLTLDIGALERAAAEAHTFKPNDDLPPPPQSLFKKPDTGRYRALTQREEDTAPPVRRPSIPPRPASIPPRPASIPPRPASIPPRPASIPPAPFAADAGPKRMSSPPPPVATPTAPQADRRDDASQRYAPARPAAIFGQARPQQGTSIFGEDLISDKSLDEVILSYLAEDLEGEGGKK